jgi:hypothetical protein
MRWAALIILCFSAALRAQPPVEPAELFPPAVMAYAEIRDAKKLTTGLTALIQGTPLEDSLPNIHNAHDGPNAVGSPLPDGVQSLALLLSPEFLGEVAKSRGAAFALLGYSEKHQPRYAGVLLLGDSPTLALAARAFLTSTPDLRRTGNVDGVPLYQHRAISAPVTTDAVAPGGMNPKDSAWPMGTDEPTYAWVPGLFIIASDAATIRETLSRFRKKSTTPSLASDADFRKLQASLPADACGLIYAKPAAWLATHTRATQARKELPTPTLAGLQFLVKLAEIPLLTGSLTITGEQCEWAFDITTDNAKHPLQTLARSPKPKDKFLQNAQAAATNDLTITLPEGEARTQVLLQIMDGIALTSGVIGAKPSEHFAEFVADPKHRKVSALLNSIAAITVAGTSREPRIILQLDDSPNAKLWGTELKTLLPKLFPTTGAISSEALGASTLFRIAPKPDDNAQEWYLLVEETRIHIRPTRTNLPAIKNPTPASPREFAALSSRIDFSQLLESPTPKIVAPLLPDLRDNDILPVNPPQGLVPPGAAQEGGIFLGRQPSLPDGGEMEPAHITWLRRFPHWRATATPVGDKVRVQFWLHEPKAAIKNFFTPPKPIETPEEKPGDADKPAPSR